MSQVIWECGGVGGRVEEEKGEGMGSEESIQLDKK